MIKFFEFHMNSVTGVELVQVPRVPGTCGIYGHTVTINELLCMKNAGAQIAMDFS